MTNWQTQSQELFGYHWKLCVSLLAGVDKRTVQRWNSGEMGIPTEIEEKLTETYKIWRK